MDKLEPDKPATPVEEINISLSSTESEPSVKPEEGKLSEMRMIEDVLTLCHFPGSNPDVPERSKRARVLPTVSLSLLCFSPPLATTPPPSPRLIRSHSPSPSFDCEDRENIISSTSSTFEKQNHKSQLLEKLEDSLNTPCVTAAEGTGFFGNNVLLDPPVIGK